MDAARAVVPSATIMSAPRRAFSGGRSRAPVTAPPDTGQERGLLGYAGRGPVT